MFPPKKLKGLILRVSHDRLFICGQCYHNSKFHKSRLHKFFRPDEHCILCGCTLSAKVRCLSCACDIHKWEAVMTSEQEEEINEQK